jgi:hypothetical protein
VKGDETTVEYRMQGSVVEKETMYQQADEDFAESWAVFYMFKRLQ